MDDLNIRPFPASIEDPVIPSEESQIETESRWARIWDVIVRAGMGEITLRLATGLASLLLILLVVWVMGTFYLTGNIITADGSAQAAAITETPSSVFQAKNAPALTVIDSGIPRQALLHTTLPNRPRTEILVYEVQPGDNVFGIAEKFNLRPETIMWGNLDILGDDPHRLSPGQRFIILPVDGIYYEWHNGDGLNGVAKYFGVKPEDIINYPGNKLDASNIGDLAAPNIVVGTRLVIPGGQREFMGWNAPYRTREEPANSSLGGGANCGEIQGGPIGNGNFLWPTTERYLSGFDYSISTNHRAIDIAGTQGNPIYAVDNGVVVYAGWNDYGYGNVIVIDHGNGWQSLYAHIMDGGINVSCGTYVNQGDPIGYIGSTGNSSGPHLHFELRSKDAGNVNPWDFLQ